MPDSISSSAGAGLSPARLIASAARQTGASFDYLMQTAARESGFDASARAATSSATGLFQFIEQTWFAMLARHGDKHGFTAEAAAITRGADGRFDVADPAQRAAVLDLRLDPRAASLMAGELASENAAIIEQATGRAPSAGELYAAHFLGASGAVQLIEQAVADPARPADQVFPAAAAANRPVFYREGRPVSVGELVERLTGQAITPVAETETMRPSSDPPTDAPRAGRSWYAQAAYGAARVGDGVLTPALLELLASLEAPERSDRNR